MSMETVTLDQAQWQTVLGRLGKVPFEEIAQIYLTIQQQLGRQRMDMAQVQMGGLAKGNGTDAAAP